jgi:hypothetical protein
MVLHVEGPDQAVHSVGKLLDPRQFRKLPGLHLSGTQPGKRAGVIFVHGKEDGGCLWSEPPWRADNKGRTQMVTVRSQITHPPCETQKGHPLPKPPGWAFFTGLTHPVEIDLIFPIHLHKTKTHLAIPTSKIFERPFQDLEE